MSGQTLVERILSEKSGRDVRAGDIVIAKVDLAYVQDGTGAPTFRPLEALGGPQGGAPPPCARGPGDADDGADGPVEHGNRGGREVRADPVRRGDEAIPEGPQAGEGLEAPEARLRRGVRARGRGGCEGARADGRAPAPGGQRRPRDGPEREGPPDPAGLPRQLHERAGREQQGVLRHPEGREGRLGHAAHRDPRLEGVVREVPEGGPLRRPARRGRDDQLPGLRGVPRRPRRDSRGRGERAEHDEPELRGADGDPRRVHVPRVPRHGRGDHYLRCDHGPAGGGVTGRAWKFGDNISTDLIAAGRYYHLRSNLPELAKHVLEDARKEFAEQVKKGDFVVGGREFRVGTGREHAPLIIKIAGTRAVLAKSFARIFYRNWIKLGLAAGVVGAGG